MVTYGITYSKERSMSQVTKGEDGRYYKDCSECGEPQNYLRKNYAEESLRLAKMCKKCSNKMVNNTHRGWHRKIRISWYNKFRTSALLRNKDWYLDIDEVADMYDSQDGKCALSGCPVMFPIGGHPQDSDCSIDRIDSSKGYWKDNIQLVHKKVNMMKQHYSQEEFIQVCRNVTANTKDKKLNVQDVYW
jgi:ribosomal protein S14